MYDDKFNNDKSVSEAAVHNLLSVINWTGNVGETLHDSLDVINSFY